MRWTRSPWVRDIGIVVVLLVLALLGDSVTRSLVEDLEGAVPLGDILLLCVVIMPLLVRRRYPLTVLAVTTVGFLAARIAEVPEGSVTSVAMFVSLFSAGAYSSHRGRDGLRTLSVVLSMGVLLNFLVGEAPEMPGNVVLIQVFSLLLNVVFYGAAWLMGDMWRTRLEDRQELARRAEVLEKQKDLLAVQAVAEERLRIARELHDIVGHHVSVMGVQAGAARRTLGHDRPRTEELLSSIESSGRQAVTEMSRLVGLLRDPTEHATTPQPTLEGLDDLVTSISEAGLEVAVHRVGRPRALDTTTDLSVFRIVQESLTNALRHGAQRRAVVEVTYLVDHLRVRVRNPANGSTPGVGRGVVGMVERASLVGGTVTAGSGPDGWFEVSGTFPYGSSQ